MTAQNGFNREINLLTINHKAAEIIGILNADTQMKLFLATEAEYA